MLEFYQKNSSLFSYVLCELKNKKLTAISKTTTMFLKSRYAKVNDHFKRDACDTRPQILCACYNMSPTHMTGQVHCQ